MEKNELPKEDVLVQCSKEGWSMAMKVSSSGVDAEKDDPVNSQLEKTKGDTDVTIETNNTNDCLGVEESVNNEEEEGSDTFEMFLDDSDGEQSNNTDDESIAEVCVCIPSNALN
jgi:hypothetical protein